MRRLLAVSVAALGVLLGACGLEDAGLAPPIGAVPGTAGSPPVGGPTGGDGTGAATSGGGPTDGNGAGGSTGDGGMGGDGVGGEGGGVGTGGGGTGGGGTGGVGGNPGDGGDGGDGGIGGDGGAGGAPPATCADVECANGGTCDDGSGAAVCTCDGDFAGDRCRDLVVGRAINLHQDNLGTRTCDDGGDMVAYSIDALTATTATLTEEPAEGCLAAGDEVLLINLQGRPGQLDNVGRHEVLRIASVSGGTVTFQGAKQSFYGSGPGNDDDIGVAMNHQRVVLQRVPTYDSVTVTATGMLTGMGWSGLRGGVFFLKSRGPITVASGGLLTMRNRGYRGGPTTTGRNNGGQQGESLAGVGVVSNESNLGGGGGGTGDGECVGNGTSGGGGAHVEAGQPGANSCDVKAGVAYTGLEEGRFFLGSGGGAGGTDNKLSDNPDGGFGGTGGGILMLEAAGTISGTISAEGFPGQGPDGCPEDGTSDSDDCFDFSGPGGGGAGGTVWLKTASDLTLVDVRGGPGGIGSVAGVGGDGGAGRYLSRSP